VTAGIPERGVLVAVDVGTVRVGVAASDPGRILASPVETVPARDVARVAQIVADRAAVCVVVGLPRTLAGREGSSVIMARDFAAALGPMIAPVPIALVVSRLTTVLAEQALTGAGVRGRSRRKVVDQAAAVALLQGVLDAAR
jgi:putative Holliday junction resolvase